MERLLLKVQLKMGLLLLFAKHCLLSSMIISFMYWLNMLQMLPGLGLVLGLILLLAWLAKRTGMGRAAIGGALRIVADKSVGARERVVVVEIAGQWLVLGVAPGQVRTLTQMPRPEQTAVIAPDSATKPSFATWLERALKKT